jgi:hypothetical protein
MREMTQKGDPILRIQLPEVLQNELRLAAQQNKRRPQDEFIKRIAASFRAEGALGEMQFDMLQAEKMTQNLMHFAQMIPSEMMASLKLYAERRGISVGQEIASRLFATFAEASALGVNMLSQNILGVSHPLLESVFAGASVLRFVAPT